MRAAAFTRMESHLSSEGVFLMADAQKPGFPIRYASAGFERLYGFRGTEVVGKKCGELIGGPSIIRRTGDLVKVANCMGSSCSEARAQLQFLTGKAAEACRVMMSAPGERVGASLLLNRKRGGTLIVCECIVLNLMHPTLNWSYCVGFQRDITKEVAIESLLAATSDDQYAMLLCSRRCALDRRRSVLLGVGKDEVVRYLHLKALDIFQQDIWKIIRSDVLEHTIPPRNEVGSRLRLASPSAACIRAPSKCQGVICPSKPTEVSYMRSAVGACRSLVDSKQSNPMAAFLEDADLSLYLEPLLSNGFDDLETLLEIRDEDMAKLGMPLGHVLKLRRKISVVKGADNLLDPSCDGCDQIKNFGLKLFDCLVFRYLIEKSSEDSAQQNDSDSCKIGEDPCDKTIVDHPAMFKLCVGMVNTVSSMVSSRDISDLVQMSRDMRELQRLRTISCATRHTLNILKLALRCALRDVLKEAFTLEVEQQWDIAYSFVLEFILQTLPPSEASAITKTPSSTSTSTPSTSHKLAVAGA